MKLVKEGLNEKRYGKHTGDFLSDLVRLIDEYIRIGADPVDLLNGLKSATISYERGEF